MITPQNDFRNAASTHAASNSEETFRLGASYARARIFWGMLGRGLAESVVGAEKVCLVADYLSRD